MKKYKQDWEGATTLNFRMFWPWSVRRLPAHALFFHPTFDAPCLRFFILTLFTAKSMDWSKCWRWHIIAASRAFGQHGFNWLIDPTFAGHRERWASSFWVTCWGERSPEWPKA